MKYKVFHPPGYKIPYMDRFLQDVLYCSGLKRVIRRFEHRTIGRKVMFSSDRDVKYICTRWEMKEVEYPERG